MTKKVKEICISGASSKHLTAAKAVLTENAKLAFVESSVDANSCTLKQVTPLIASVVFANFVDKDGGPSKGGVEVFVEWFDDLSQHGFGIIGENKYAFWVEEDGSIKIAKWTQPPDQYLFWQKFGTKFPNGKSQFVPYDSAAFVLISIVLMTFTSLMASLMAMVIADSIFGDGTLFPIRGMTIPAFIMLPTSLASICIALVGAAIWRFRRASTLESHWIISGASLEEKVSDVK